MVSVHLKAVPIHVSWDASTDLPSEAKVSQKLQTLWSNKAPGCNGNQQPTNQKVLNSLTVMVSIFESKLLFHDWRKPVPNFCDDRSEIANCFNYLRSLIVTYGNLAVTKSRTMKHSLALANQNYRHLRGDIWGFFIRTVCEATAFFFPARRSVPVAARMFTNLLYLTTDVSKSSWNLLGTFG